MAKQKYLCLALGLSKASLRLVFLIIRVQEGLFWVLEQEGWIHPYTAVWEADLPVS